MESTKTAYCPETRLVEPARTVYCPRCKKTVEYHYEQVNHWQQLAATVFTVGLWLPMWLIMTFAPTKLCNDCGGPLWHDTK